MADLTPGSVLPVPYGFGDLLLAPPPTVPLTSTPGGIVQITSPAEGATITTNSITLQGVAAGAGGSEGYGQFSVDQPIIPVSMNSIASAEAFGEFEIRKITTVSMNSIASAEAFSTDWFITQIIPEPAEVHLRDRRDIDIVIRSRSDITIVLRDREDMNISMAPVLSI
jgi:hypothetical protein